jgi:rhamnose transport system ATP-binding protein
MDYILELRHISKTFPGVKALQDVHFTLGRGEIHALMGENGAGKSTFIKVITGVHQPDEGGGFFVDGKPANVRGPLDAQALGIAAIKRNNDRASLRACTARLMRRARRTQRNTKRKSNNFYLFDFAGKYFLVRLDNINFSFLCFDFQKF